MRRISVEPFREFERFAKGMNEFINEVGKGVTFEVGGFIPRIDILEDETNIYLAVELPGISKDDVKVVVSENHLLTISGEKKKIADGEKKFKRVERMYGPFSRSLALPSIVKTDAISADFSNGILNLTIPKIQPTKPKEFTVNIG